MLSRRGFVTWIRFPVAFMLTVCLPVSALAAPDFPQPVRQVLPHDPKCTAAMSPAAPAKSRGQAPAPRKFAAAMVRPDAAARAAVDADVLTGAYAAPARRSE